MNLKDLKAELRRQQKELNSGRDKALRTAALTVNAEVARRIFVDGKAQEGDIGSYSTKPMLVSRSAFAKKSAFKKEKWIKFPTSSKAVPVMELKGGYKQLRAIQGRPTNKVNLDYTSETKKDFENSVRKHKTGYAAIVKRDRSAVIIEGNERRFKKRIFSLGDKEVTRFKTILTKELLRWISKG